MTSRDEEDPLAITAFGHIESSSAFVPRRRLGTDAITESGGKEPTDLHNGLESTRDLGGSRNLGRTDRVTMDSRNSTWTSMMSFFSRSSLH